MIVNARQVVRHLPIALMVLQQALHVCLDLNYTIVLLIVGHKHVRVYLVYKNFVVEIRLHRACLLNQLFQLLACSVVLLGLRVDDVDKRATVRNVSLRVVL